MSSPNGNAPEIAAATDAIVAELDGTERFLITTHEGPDGDALGSTLALQEALTQLGKDSIMFLAEKEFPLPLEYRFLPLQEVFHEAPADLADRTVIFLDCGNIDRMPVDWLRDGKRMLNIDHHHDNTRFADVNLVDVNASSTAEIVFDICRRLGVEITGSIAQALYVGLITDTGQFMYENTDARTHRVAAELIESGRRRQRDLPAPLRARAGGEAEADRPSPRPDRPAARRRASRRPTSPPTTTRRPGADETLTEGIIDFVRGIEGTAVAAVVRDKPDGHRRGPQGQPALDRRLRRRLGDRPEDGRRRASARCRLLDRSQLRRARRVPQRRDPRRAWLSRPIAPRRLHLQRQARRRHLPRRRRPLPARARRQGPATPGRSTRSPPGLLIVLLGAATRLQRYVLGLPKTYLATARLGWRSTTGDPDGELTETGRIPERLELPTGRIAQTVPMTSAVRVGGERLYRKAHRGEQVERPDPRGRDPPGRADRDGGGDRDVRDRMLVGHLRPDADRDARRRLLLGAAADRRSAS